MDLKAFKEMASNMSEEELLEKAHAVIKKMAADGTNVKEAMNVNEDLLEEIYSLAYAHYESGNYKDSISLFQFLTGTSPDTYKYVFGLGANFHQLEDYENALYSFYLAFSIEPDNPLPAYFIADTFYKMGMMKEASEFLEITTESCANNPEHKELKERSALMAQGIKQDLKKKKAE